MGQPVHVRFGSSLCENSDVQLARGKFVSITLNNKRTARAATVEGRKERKQFCAFSARARFHTTWVISGSRVAPCARPLFPHERTFVKAAGTSALCQQETHAPQQRRLSFESHWHYDDFREHT